MWRTLFWFAAAAAAFGSTLAAEAAEPTHPFAISDLLGLRRVAAAQISPSGKRVAYVVEQLPTRTAPQRAELWIAELDTGRSVRVDAAYSVISAEMNWRPTWAPTETALAYPTHDSTELKIYDRQTGTTKSFRPGVGAIQNIAWAPDGSRLALTASGGHAIAVLTPADARMASLPVGDISPDGIAWSPSGRNLAFVAQGDLYLIAASGGAPTPLVVRAGRDELPVWSRDGRHILFSTQRGDPEGPCSFGIVDPDRGPPRDLAPRVDVGLGRYSTRFLAWGPDGRSVYFARLDHMTHRLNRLDLSSGAARPFVAARRADHDFSVSADGRRAAFIVSDPARPGSLFVADLSPYREREIATETSSLAASPTGDTKPETWRSGDGTEIEGLLLLPPGWRPGKPLPLVVLMEGTYGSFDYSFSSRAAADNDVLTPFQQYLFAGQGYAVLMPNPRGSWGYGPAFSRKGLKDFGVGPHDDVMTGVEQLVRDGVADPSRVALLGMWTDGYRTLYSLTHSQTFRAAIVINGLFNLDAAYGGDSQALLDRMLGGPPWTHRDVYDALSPSRAAQNLRTPTLLVATRGDPCCYEEQARGALAALRANGVPGRIEMYDKPETLFEYGPAWIAAMEMVQAWLRDHLGEAKGGPSPTSRRPEEMSASPS